MLAHLTAGNLLLFQGTPYRCAIGAAGISPAKVEGDHATPAGTLLLRRVYYRADRVRRPQTVVPTEPVAETDGWCDDPTSRDYNRPITLPHDAHHEELWRRDPLYDVIGVLGWNDAPVVRARGSAIFLHVAQADYAPTQGCIALALADLVALLAKGLSGIEVG